MKVQVWAPNIQNLTPPATAPQHNDVKNSGVIMNAERPPVAPLGNKDSPIRPRSPTSEPTKSREPTPAGEGEGELPKEGGELPSSDDPTARAGRDGAPASGDSRRAWSAPLDASRRARRSLALRVRKAKFNWKEDMGKKNTGWQPNGKRGTGEDLAVIVHS